MAGFPVARVPCVCFLPLLHKGLGSPIKGTGLEPKFDFSLCSLGQELPVLRAPFLFAETDREG